jgi:hypothetical protein
LAKLRHERIKASEEVIAKSPVGDYRWVVTPLSDDSFIHYTSPVYPAHKEKNMLKKKLILLFALVLTFPVAVVFAQQAPAQAKEARWEGRIIRSNKDSSSLTVRKAGSATLERTVVFDSSTKWVSQYHADKNVNVIDPGEVKDGDYVICTGTWGDDHKLHANLVSKRLSHPN